MRCRMCNDAVNDLYSVTLRPCGHQLCHCCALSISFRRDPLHPFCCPCEGKIESACWNRVHEIAPPPRETRKRRKDGNEPTATKELREESVVVSHYKPHLRYDPFRLKIRELMASDAFKKGGWDEVLGSGPSRLLASRRGIRRDIC
mmetsp:Transcript_36051/g.78958  ORF Transcript_36051/g.78958 Transcript_36051/m.78958 type:complete len:146 (+) Transcript_36051:43-480(+)